MNIFVSLGVDLILLFHYVSCLNINSTCNYNNSLQIGREYFMYSPGFPGNYTGPLVCRWLNQSPEDTVIVTRCNILELPIPQNCTEDSLAYSPTGDENFQDGYTMTTCSQSPFIELSYGQNMAFGLFSNSGGTGRFLCSLAAVKPAQNCQCGVEINKKIVGGQETGVHQYPFMAALADNANQIVFCGASIITTKHAITAAHCLTSQTPKTLELLVGAHYLNQAKSTHDAALYYEIENFFIMPNFSASYYQNDIAIVQTLNYIEFNLFVSPVCLPFKYGQYNFDGAPVIALGWGYQHFSGYMANTLQEVELKALSNQQCAAQIPAITVSSLCTFTSGKDACIGDSGGPIVWKDSNSNKLELVALISYGYGCASDKPAVNTRISAYVPWIVSVTPDAEYCFY